MTASKAYERQLSGQTVKNAGRAPDWRIALGERLPPLQEVHAALGQRGGALLEHDDVVVAVCNRLRDIRRLPVVLEREAAGRAHVVLDRLPGSARERGDGRGQVVGRGEAVPDEENALRRRVRGRRDCQRQKCDNGSADDRLILPESGTTPLVFAIR